MPSDESNQSKPNPQKNAFYLVNYPRSPFYFIPQSPIVQNSPSPEHQLPSTPSFSLRSG